MVPKPSENQLQINGQSDMDKRGCLYKKHLDKIGLDISEKRQRT